MKIKIEYEINQQQDLIEQVIKNRNLNLDWLTAGQEYFNDGSTMYNFQKGYNIIEKIIKNQLSVGILVDQDTDGFCSAAMMGQWLKDKNLNLEIQYIIPEGKIHGLILDIIPKDIDVLIIPDASSSENDKHEILCNQGIEILILDHHEFTQEESKYACIINPHNPKCSYPNKNISGAGVVFKFIESYDKQNQNEDYFKYIDLAAVATVADVMDLKNFENKAIVNIGLKNIQNPYFKAYLKADSRIKDKPIDATLISFYLSPQINALVRIGTVDEKRALLEAMIGETAAELVVASIIKIKRKQDGKKEPILTRIVMNLKNQNLEDGNIIITQAPKTTPRAMSGLIAGQLASLYNKPVLLGHINEEGNMIGSARSINASTIANLKDFCEQSGLFNFQAGHQSAFGFSIKEEKIINFIEYCKDNLPPFEKIFSADFMIPENKAETIIILEKLKEHYGPGFPEILIYDTFYITPRDFRIAGKLQNTLIITKPDLTYIKFRTKESLPDKPGILKVIGKPNMNKYNDIYTPQMIIEELEWLELEL